MHETGILAGKAKEQPDDQQKIAGISNVASCHVTVDGKDCSLFIRIIGCLEEPVTFHIQHVIHEDSFRTGFAVYVYNDFTFIGRRAG